MPYHITHIDGRLEIAMTGTVTITDLRDLAAEITAIEASSVPVPNRLLDIGASTGLRLDFAAIHEVATQRRSISLPNPIKSAIVASDPVHVGFARMFQLLMDNPLITVAIFPDLEHARAWLMAS